MSFFQISLIHSSTNHQVYRLIKFVFEKIQRAAELLWISAVITYQSDHVIEEIVFQINSSEAACLFLGVISSCLA
jgi:hypothetical protein